MKQYKTSLAQRLSQQKYLSLHKEEQMLSSQKWHKANPEKVKVLNDKWNSIRNSRKITFKGKRILLSENPRTGICSKCGRSIQKEEIKRTHMHHDEYDKSNPLAHTRELCASCHRKEHNK